MHALHNKQPRPSGPIGQLDIWGMTALKALLRPEANVFISESKSQTTEGHRDRITVTSRSGKLAVLSVFDINRLQMCEFVYKRNYIFHFNSDHHSHKTRQPPHLHIPRVKTRLGQFSV